MPLTGITAVRPTPSTAVQNIIYGATIAAGQSLYLDGLDSKHKLSDANLSAAAAAARAIAITPGVDNGSGLVAVAGNIILVGTTMLTGETYYAGPTAGQIIAASELTAGDSVTRLGTAATATQLNLDIVATGIVRG